MPDDIARKEIPIELQATDLATRCSLLANLWGFGKGVEDQKHMCQAFDQSGGGQAAVALLMRSVRKDYGALVAEAMKNIPQCSAPVTAALISVMEAEGHNMYAVRQELQFLVESVGVAFGW